MVAKLPRISAAPETGQFQPRPHHGLNYQRHCPKWKQLTPALSEQRLKPPREQLVYRLLNPLSFAAGQLAVFQGASEVPISVLYGSSEQRRKTSNWPRP